MADAAEVQSVEASIDKCVELANHLSDGRFVEVYLHYLGKEHLRHIDLDYFV